jgi:hypothetical protein
MQNNYIPQQPPVQMPTQLNARFSQSEESGGAVATESDCKSPEEQKEGENDIEYIIMNLYSKMKNLENKYIDLANFYKQELVRGQSISEDNAMSSQTRPFSSGNPYEKS